MKNPSQPRSAVRANVLFALGVGLLLMMSVAASLSVRQLERAAEFRVHTYQVLDRLEEVRGALLEVETSARGFALSGTPECLEPYEAGRPAVGLALTEVRVLTAEKPVQQRNLAELETLVQDRLARSEQLVRARREGGPDAAQKLVAAGGGQDTRDAARRVLARMEQEERRLLALREADLQRAGQQSLVVTAVARLVTIALFVTAFLFYRRERRRRAAAEAGLQQSNAELEQRVQQRTGELAHANDQLRLQFDELRRTEQEVRRLLETAEQSRRSLLSVVEDQQQAEAARRESEERLRLALEAAHLGTFDWDLPRNHIAWSRWHEELWGFKPGEFDGTYEAFSGRVHPEDLPGLNAEVARCIAARARFTREFRVVWPEGSVHWITGRGEFTFGEDGQPRRMRGAVVETTARKHAEEALQLMCLCVDQAGDGVFWVSPEGRLLYVNDSACQALGYSESELLGLKIFDLDPDYQPGVWATHWVELKRRGTMTFETRHRTKDGRMFPIEVNANYVRAGGQELNFAFTRNITERKRAEEELREKEHLLSESQRLAHIGSWVYDLTGRITWSEETYRIYGVSPETFSPTAESFLGLLHPVDQPAMQAWIAACVAGEKPGDLEYRAILRDGTLRFISGRGELICDAEGRPSHMTGTAQDITERKQAEQRIHHLNRVYSVLSEINQTIVRVRDRRELFDTACRIAVEKGGFRLAWIGLLEPPANGLKLVAHAGAAPDTLAVLNEIFDDPQRGCAVTAQALETGAPAVCNYIAHEPQAASWREAALQRGYRAMASLPLRVEDKVIGTFNLYAGEPGFFDEEELRLLEELAADISFALEVSRRETRRQRAEAARDALLDLETKLSAARDPVEAARCIFAAADKLWAWDCGALEVYEPGQDLTHAVLTFDIIEGERREVDPIQPHSTPTVRARRIMEQGAELILRPPPFTPEPGATMFGDVSRPSASLMFVPIRWQGRSVGVLSVQSYTPNAFTEEDLRTLQGLADHCGGTLERIRADEARRTSEERFRELVSSVDGIVWEADAATFRFDLVSAPAERLLGYPIRDWLEQPEFWREHLHPEDRGAAVVYRVTCTQEKRDHEFDYRMVAADGRIVWLHDAVTVVVEGDAPLKLRGIMVDITERKHAEARVVHLNQLLGAIRDISKLIVRERDPQRLVREACEILVRTRGYLLVWVGFPEAGSKKVLPVAKAGQGGDYLDQITVTWDDTPTGQGMVGIAFRTRQPQICQDIASDPRFAPWRTILREQGYASLAAMPLVQGGRLFGALSVYADTVNAFDAEETGLLEELAHDLAFALHSIEQEQERQRAEEALHRTEQLYRHAIAVAGAVPYNYDYQTRTYLFMGEGIEPLTGYRAEEICGPLWRQIIQESVMLGEAAGLSKEEAAQRVLRGEIRHWRCDLRILTRDGKTRWLSDVSVPKLDAAGRAIGSMGILQDITERRLAAETLEQNEKRFRSLIENASDVITVVNHQGVIRFQSPSAERVMGFTPAELAGRNAFESIHPDDLATVKQALERAVLNPAVPITVQYRLRHRDGTWRLLESLGRNIPGEAEDGYIVINSRDITESRKLEDQFRQSQKMEAIGQLAGGVAHDFNNILAAILMNADLLDLGGHLSAEQLEHIGEIGQAAQRAANLNRQLLLFSRKQTPQLRDLDLNENVASLHKMLRRILGEDVQIQLKPAPQPLAIHADPGMVDQVLMNLVVNARDAMPNGGQLIIETAAIEFDELTAAHSPQARPGAFVCLSVSDSGGGIPPEVLPRIFEPFFTTKDVGQGTGLGLATVLGIVQLHQGWVDVKSQVGLGTVFRVYFPRLTRTTEKASIPLGATSLPGGRETILLVEDDSFVRSTVRNALSRLGYRVLESFNGVNALEVWKQKQAEIHLLMTDLVMPEGMNGRELARRLLEENPKLKVIYTSGYSAEVAGKDFPLEEGVNFLAKPFPALKLAATIRAVLDAN